MYYGLRTGNLTFNTDGFFSYQGHECIYVNMNFMFSYILPTDAFLALHIH